MPDETTNQTAPTTVVVTMRPLVLTPQQAADALQISTRHLWALTKRGEIQAIRQGKKFVRYAVSELERWVAEQQAKSSDSQTAA